MKTRNYAFLITISLSKFHANRGYPITHIDKYEDKKQLPYDELCKEIMRVAIKQWHKEFSSCSLSVHDYFVVDHISVRREKTKKTIANNQGV